MVHRLCGLPKQTAKEWANMANIQGQIQEARAELMRAAAQRWIQHSEQREVAVARIHAQRRFAERIVGPSNDLVDLSPSELALRTASSVARITTVPDAGYAAQGVASGLLLPGGLLLTNHHVFPSSSAARGYAANFNHARDEQGLRAGVFFELDPDGFYVSDEKLDFALVGVKAKGTAQEDLAAVPAIRLIEATGKILRGHPVNIIQHPNGGPRQFAVTNNSLVDILAEGFLHYEADTDRGSSGSPVFNDDWEMLALHHCGVPLMQGVRIIAKDDSVWDESMGEQAIRWVANEGTRVSFIVKRLRAFALPTPGQRSALQALLASSADPLDESQGAVLRASTEAAQSFSTGGSNMAHSFHFHGASTLHVYAQTSAPGAEQVGKVLAAPVDTESTTVSLVDVQERALVFDPDYAGRKGYDERFLGVSVPMPTLKRELWVDAYSVDAYRAYFNEYMDVPEFDTSDQDGAQPMRLDYHHFSLLHNAKFRMSHVSAMNCDYRPIARQDTRAREEFGGEDWRADPRVPLELQLLNEDVYQPARRVDRGHLVRREDSCWGAAGLETEYANADTYHWTNCTPQHEAFNQASPRDGRASKKKGIQSIYAGKGVKGLWGGFESAVEKQLEAGGGKAVLFAGPVLAGFFAATDWGTGRVSIPKRFWKVVVLPESKSRSRKLLAYGYLFDQEPVVRHFGLDWKERLDLPQFDGKRVSLSEISGLTGVLFDAVVMAAEVAVD
jgi:endonuclease G, mitochondrial